MSSFEPNSAADTPVRETSSRAAPAAGDGIGPAQPRAPRAQTDHYNENYFNRRAYAKRPLGRFSMYWFARRYYAALMRRFAPVTGGTLLEVASGLGHLLGLLQDDFQCTGIDLMEHAVEQTRMRAPRAKVFQANADQPLQFETGEFSAVVALHLVEHLERPREFISEIRRVMQPGAIFLFVTPNPEYKLRRFKDPLTDITFMDPGHINVQPPAVWRAWCAENGLRVERHFADGLYDVPYLPLLPNKLQFGLFGWPALLQVLMQATIIPLDWGVNQIVVARNAD